MSNGQFWYGKSTGFPGFLYKKNNGVGGRRSTKMNPGGNTTCNIYITNISLEMVELTKSMNI